MRVADCGARPLAAVRAGEVLRMLADALAKLPPLLSREIEEEVRYRV